jgi:hypothetical protein
LAGLKRLMNDNLRGRAEIPQIDGRMAQPPHHSSHRFKFFAWLGAAPAELDL